MHRFRLARAQTDALARSFSPEDLNLQSMREASPGKWHLAHTSWFFETFLLERFNPNHAPFDPSFRGLFNSYYNSLGPQPARERRAFGRPSLPEVLSYRAFVDDGVSALWPQLRDSDRAEATRTLELGIQHEQQHQELFLTDLKHALAIGPSRAGTAKSPTDGTPPPPLAFLPRPEGLFEIGATEDAAFSFDIERPRHRVFLERHALASRLITNGEYLGFMGDSGYTNPLLWLSEGFAVAKREGWQAPLYWRRAGDRWTQRTHAGAEISVDPHAPVAHVSYYEADAFARWAGARLPTEAEWELAATELPVAGNFLESGELTSKRTSAPASALAQMFGDTWEWTQSAYLPYPRFQPLDGALAEYNAKFMVNQMVLRGGSAFSPTSHLRASYRNFFAPETRWQLSGIRLARDVK